MKKSTITFNTNMSANDKGVVLAVLGLHDVQSHDKYLDFPTVLGRNKHHTFEDIKGCVWKRVQGSHRNSFSARGVKFLSRRCYNQLQPMS